ncbi:hypothetical protein ACFCZ6_33465 [Streptomyces hydrogenans]|uniref:hypothetical protein n=1 Tax=Streptomyces hydrogenans TaxID=1873719 RepID=UPI0035DE0475
MSGAAGRWSAGMALWAAGMRRATFRSARSTGVRRAVSSASRAAASARAMAGVALGGARGVCFASGGLGAVGVDLVGLGLCLQGLDSLLLGVGLSSNTGGFLGTGFGRYETDAGVREIDQRSGRVVVPWSKALCTPWARERGMSRQERVESPSTPSVAGTQPSPARWAPGTEGRAGVSR